MLANSRIKPEQTQGIENGLTSWKYVILAILPGVLLLIIPRGILLDFNRSVRSIFEQFLIYLGIPLFIWMFLRNSIHVWQLMVIGALFWMFTAYFDLSIDMPSRATWIFLEVKFYLVILGVLCLFFLGWRFFRKNISGSRRVCFLISAGLLILLSIAGFSETHIVSILLCFIVLGLRWKSDLGIKTGLLISSMLSAMFSSVLFFPYWDWDIVEELLPPMPLEPPSVLGKAGLEMFFNLLPIVGLFVILPIGVLRSRTDRAKKYWLLGSTFCVVFSMVCLYLVFLRDPYMDFKYNLWITGIGYISLLMLPVVFSVLIYHEKNDN